MRASNPGGNAESIASFAVVDSTPERIVEVVKTVVFEDPVDRTRKVSKLRDTLHKTPIYTTHSRIVIVRAIGFTR